MLEQDKEEPESQLEGCPNIFEIDSWVVDFNEDCTTKEESMKEFITRHVTGYPSSNEQMINQQAATNKMVAP